MEVRKHSRSPGRTDVEERAPNSTEKGDNLKDELDALLKEIDGVLEENAGEFVRAYVQKGGQ